MHAEHREIYDSAMNGNELRAALALEAHIRTTAELVARALHGNGHAPSTVRSTGPNGAGAVAPGSNGFAADR